MRTLPPTLPQAPPSLSASRAAGGAVGFSRSASPPAGHFARTLTLAHRGEPPHTPGERARFGAEQLVAIAFVEPLLKMARESEGAAPPFAPTDAEKQFRALLDADLAHRIVRSANFPLVDRLARELLKGLPSQEAPPSGVLLNATA